MAMRSLITVCTLLSLRERQVGTRDPQLCVGKARFASKLWDSCTSRFSEGKILFVALVPSLLEKVMGATT